jgi:hypothetical protein
MTKFSLRIADQDPAAFGGSRPTLKVLASRGLPQSGLPAPGNTSATTLLIMAERPARNNDCLVATEVADHGSGCYSLAEFGSQDWQFKKSLLILQNESGESLWV